MSVTVRIVQRFDPRHEREFIELEQQFAELEAARKDYPDGKRMQPISGRDPTNTLIWECEFPDLDSAWAALGHMGTDPDHDELFERQVKFFQDARIEFYQNLDF